MLASLHYNEPIHGLAPEVTLTEIVTEIYTKIDHIVSNLNQRYGRSTKARFGLTINLVDLTCNATDELLIGFLDKPVDRKDISVRGILGGGSKIYKPLQKWGVTPFRIEDAHRQLSNSFISAPKGGILNEKWCKKCKTQKHKKKTHVTRKNQ
jgi:hypothetical protein